ncbi:MAG: ribonucleoside-diphosphate reductase subunit alpha [Candidatus Dojkabacteria bacterium]|nr:ribonucleoside-diphosphate reductase subunit alpha [Candidatus Dojkabacteria bacterium]
MIESIYVTKRNGTKEKLNIEKIHKVLMWATEGLKNVSVSDIEINAQLQFFNGIQTRDIHKILIQSAVNLISEKNINYQYVAANLLNYYLRKEVFNAKTEQEIPSLFEIISTNVKNGIYDKILLEKYTKEEIDFFELFLDHKRDYLFTYAGLQQLVDKYLLKNRKTGQIYETPQIMFMAIAMTVFSSYPKEIRHKYIEKLYNYISKFYINLPTPILCGVRTPLHQYSSCVLIDVGDSLESITQSNTAIMKYTAKRAGIGLNVGRIRALGSPIRNGDVIHTGLIPYLKLFEAATKCTTQNGVRGGSATVHFPFWHLEFEELIVLKNNKGNEENRVRKLDYSVQLNKLFFERVKENKNITLFSPHEVPDLYDAFLSTNIERFKKLYEYYESKDGLRKKILSARDMLLKIAQERLETGRIYLMFIDNVNNHSSFKDPISMSNLCQEITLPTTPLEKEENGNNGEIALCVLSAINIGMIKNLKELEDIADIIVRTLDFVIEEQDYPIKEARKMKERRSIGVGITNLAYYLAKHKVKYTEEKAWYLVDELAEAVQYYLLKASNNLAKEKGKCLAFEKTKYADGLLPIDHYHKRVDEIVKRKLSFNWEELRENIKKYGLRNSTLTAQMPCESSSVLTNSTNGIEPIRDLIIVKKSKQGLIKQVVPEANKIGHQYTFAFEMENNTGFLNIVAILQKYFDQAISMNTYYDFTKYNEKEIPISHVVNDILYAYAYGLKTMYYCLSNDGKTDEHIDQQNGCAGGGCTV